MNKKIKYIAYKNYKETNGSLTPFHLDEKFFPRPELKEVKNFILKKNQNILIIQA